MKTPMQELDEFWLNYNLENGKSGLRLKIKQLLEKEKQAFIDSNVSGTKDVWATVLYRKNGNIIEFTENDEIKFQIEGEQYYNETYNNEN